MTTPDDRTLDDLVADRYRLMSSAERDELVRHMADAIAALRERIATLEKDAERCLIDAAIDSALAASKEGK